MSVLKDFVKHRYTGFVLEGLKFLVLAVALFHVGDRVNTLDTAGCYGYYGKFHDVNNFSNVRFLDRGERGNLLNSSGESFDSVNFTTDNRGLN